MKRASAQATFNGGSGVRYLLFPLVLGVLILATLLLAPAAGGQPAGPPVADRYIVVFNEGVNPAAAAADIARQHAAQVAHVYSSALKGFAGVVPEGRLAALQKDPRVKSVEPDLVMHIAAQAVPTGINRIDADANSFAKIDGNDDRVKVTVAVLDTGIDLYHPDLNVDAGLSRSFDSRDPSDKSDDNGHGTHVAGTIGALDNGIGVVGVAPGVTLVSVRVLGADGGGYLSDIIKGIDYVTANAGAISVANLSLGGTGVSSAYRTAFQNSVAKGVVYTVAAGNSSVDVYGRDGTFGTRDDYIPAAYPEVATISAMCDTDGNPGGIGPSHKYGSDDSFASFSNYSRAVVSGNPVDSPGKAIDLILPGVGIESTYKNGGYAIMSGTSMAAPHAAGLAALHIAKHGKPTKAADVAAVRQALIAAGMEQSSPSGLKTQNDPDANRERLGWAGDGSTPPPVDSTPPTVAIATPAADAVVSGSVTINITASDSVTLGADLVVEWAVDGGAWVTAAYSSGTAYAALWDTTAVADGTHTIQARATDAAKNLGNATPISVTVRNQSTTPTTTPTTSGAMYVSDITWKTTGPHLKAVVTVRVDADGPDDPVLANAKVSLLMARAGGETKEWADVLTNSLGQAEFQWKSAPTGTYTAAVTKLTYLDYDWDPSASGNYSQPFIIK